MRKLSFPHNQLTKLVLQSIAETTNHPKPAQNNIKSLAREIPYTKLLGPQVGNERAQDAQFMPRLGIEPGTISSSA